MNLKKEKQIRKHAQNLMLDWLKTVVPDEEKPKITLGNLQDFIPNQTHIYANGQLRISAYTLRWFAKRIKKLVRRGRTDFKTITVDEVTDESF
tara:strand:- start:769 stop:1047 length:279 start_codon:yes stop_codon:yes gene_type:complete